MIVIHAEICNSAVNNVSARSQCCFDNRLYVTFFVHGLTGLAVGSQLMVQPVQAIHGKACLIWTSCQTCCHSLRAYTCPKCTAAAVLGNLIAYTAVPATNVNLACTMSRLLWAPGTCTLPSTESCHAVFLSFALLLPLTVFTTTGAVHWCQEAGLRNVKSSI